MLKMFVTPWTAAPPAALSFTIFHSLLKFMSVDSVMLSNYLILCLRLPLLPSIFPSIRVFSNEWTLHIRWPNIGASVSVLPMNIQGWFPLGLTGVISWLSKRLSRVFSSTTILKHQFFGAQLSLWSNSHTDVLISLNKMCADMWLTSWQCLLTNYVFIIIFSMFQKVLTPDCFIFWKLTLQALFMMKSFIFYLELHTRILEEKLCREKYNEIILIRVGNPSWFLF